MGTEIFLVAVGILIVIAVFDIMVGVSNDAVNFLNSSIGSGVASRAAIMAIASFGIMAGVSFSGGMMEVARSAGQFPHSGMLLPIGAVSIPDQALQRDMQLFPQLADHVER